MKPMLAAKLDEKALSKLVFPLLASPKLDGIRCLTTTKGPVSRNLKPTPNRELQALMKELPPGLDGELVIPGELFSEVSSVVMSHGARSKLIEYWVFDSWLRAHNTFKLRNQDVATAVKRLNLDWVRHIPQTTVRTLKAVLELEEKFLAADFEGIMLRDPEAPYKYGRSTVKQQGLMKLKRFSDSEAVIIGMVELCKNLNEMRFDELGRAKRSSKKDGKVRAGTLGALQVKDCVTGIEFEIGTGFHADTRKTLWKDRKHIIGDVVKYKYQAVGVKTKPRFPVFLGFRLMGDR